MGHLGIGILEGIGIAHPVKKARHSKRSAKIARIAGFFIILV